MKWATCRTEDCPSYGYPFLWDYDAMKAYAEANGLGFLGMYWCGTCGNPMEITDADADAVQPPPPTPPLIPGVSDDDFRSYLATETAEQPEQT